MLLKRISSLFSGGRRGGWGAVGRVLGWREGTGEGGEGWGG